jgi:hypothetical protein
MAKNEVVTYRAVIAGARLMMHNEQLANPFNEYTQELSKVSKKRGKSLEDHEAIAEIEFQGGLYFDAKDGPYVPARCLNKMLVMGARRRKLGKMFEQMVIVDREVNRVEYEGPRTRKALWDAKTPAGARVFADQRLVGINAARTLRTRPLFSDWSCEFFIRVLDGAVNADDVRTALEAAETIGVLDGRPIYAGQFVTKAFAKVKEAGNVAA